MKNHPASAMIMLRVITLLVMSVSVSHAADPLPVEGIWSGILVIPDTARLRMTITVSTDENGALQSTLNVIDQNSGEIPCSSTLFESGRLIVRIEQIGIEIEGTLNSENNTIDSEFRQSGAKFPIMLSRSDAAPELVRPQEPVKPYPSVVDSRIQVISLLAACLYLTA